MSKQSLYIRTDADSSMGIGHLMRCIALGQAWLKMGGNVNFLSSCENIGLKQRILDEGFKFIPISKPCPDPSDLKKTLDHISPDSHDASCSTPWLVIDGYHFNASYEKDVRDSGIRLLVIDDMAHLPHYHADILLNQNIHALSFKYNCDEDTVRLLGPGYAMLRNEFLEFLEWERNIPEKAQNILITFGGADKGNVTMKVIRALSKLKNKDSKIKVITGPANNHREKLRESGAANSLDIRFLSSVKDMPALMKWADLAISASGSTSWELAFMGLPSLLITTAKNQEGIGECLQNEGAAMHMGPAGNINSDSLCDTLESLIFDTSKRRAMYNNGRRLFDGYGCERIVRLINYLNGQEIQVEKHIRKAKANDCLPLWHLANDPAVRKNSFSQDSIPLEEHREWFEKRLMSSDAILFVLDIVGQVAGQIRYEKAENNYASIHFSVAPAFRGRKLGKMMIEATFIEACKIFKAQYARGVVKSNNKASISSFLKTGFKNVGSDNISNSECIVFERACT